MKLNFYENNNIVYVYEYTIKEKDPYEEIIVESNINFEYPL